MQIYSSILLLIVAGIAFSFDRMAMIFAGENSIRDVITFPKTASAVSLMDDSPSTVDENQLKELHIKIRELLFFWG